MNIMKEKASLMQRALLMLLAAGAIARAGCRTKEMKSTPFYEGTDVAYTGAPEDRVNLWPVAYWREPVGSVLWPLTSFSDDHFALRPVYSQYKQNGRDGEYDEFNFLWPFCQADLKSDDYTVFPFFWGTNSDHHPYQTLFPVYWNGANYNSLFPLWIYRNASGRKHLSVLSGMAGYSSKMDAASANWCFPLWYWNSNGTFVTTVFGKWENGWAVPPLFSWGESHTNADYNAYCLLGLGGVKKSEDDIEHWAFPLYDREEFQWDNTSRSCKTHLLLNLFGWESEGGKLLSSYAFPLYSWNVGESVLTPLFYWDKEGSLLTPLGGKTVDAGTTNVYVTPLVKRTTGKNTGGMVFPIWDRKAPCDFKEKVALMDNRKLPENIKIWHETVTNMTWNEEKQSSEKPVVRTVRRASYPYEQDKTDWLLFLCSWHDRVRGDLGYYYYGKGTNMYEIVRSIERGNELFLDYKYKRTAEFSAVDRLKTADGETSEVSFLIWLYNYRRENDLMKSDTYSQHRVLWRLWDWEKKNGDVSLDVFPGFTYDSKKDGYVKTSFFWRLFRYESDPKKGANLDVFFIPLCRQSR